MYKINVSKLLALNVPFPNHKLCQQWTEEQKILYVKYAVCQNVFHTEVLNLNRFILCATDLYSTTKSNF